MWLKKGNNFSLKQGLLNFIDILENLSQTGGGVNVVSTQFWFSLPKDCLPNFWNFRTNGFNPWAGPHTQVEKLVLSSQGHNQIVFDVLYHTRVRFDSRRLQASKIILDWRLFLFFFANITSFFSFFFNIIWLSRLSRFFSPIFLILLSLSIFLRPSCIKNGRSLDAHFLGRLVLQGLKLLMSIFPVGCCKILWEFCKIQRIGVSNNLTAHKAFPYNLDSLSFITFIVNSVQFLLNVG